jgi:tetraacyldisaccharide 4'-kinase
MRLNAPFWWYREPGPLAAALIPLSQLYARIAKARTARVSPYRSSLPVICLGNFTAGGGGKTPTAIAVAQLLKAQGHRPAFLTRGYGGKTQGPILVGENDSAEAVGDEPLLLARTTPTVVAADRVAGARLIETLAASVIVMDDGFQNPGLNKDLSLILVDAALGLGNGLIMPAGPLRAPLDGQLAEADALIVVGDGGKAAALAGAFTSHGKPVFTASIVPQGDPRWLGVLPVIGFAGIARPEKFYATLQSHGARLIDRHSFPDHHRFTEKDARALLQAASERSAMLVTTEKDWVRLPEDRATALGELKFRSRPLPIAITFPDDDQARLKDLLEVAARKISS